MDQQQGYTPQKIEKLKRQLAEAPSVDGDMSLLQAIRQVAPEIAMLRKRGYSIDNLVTLLAQNAIDIKRNTLRAYLERIGRSERVNRSRSTAAISPQGTSRPSSAQALSGDGGLPPAVMGLDGIPGVYVPSPT